MSKNDRQQQILDLLKERQYIRVNELAKIIYTSPSSIRRDLAYMQNKGLVIRSYGGVTLPGTTKGVASLQDRMTQNVQEKRLIAQKAAALLSEGQTIMLDGSSTASFLVPHIAKFKSITMFTNNIGTAQHAIELGVKTNVIGGTSSGGSEVLLGCTAYKILRDIRPDVMFFSSQCISDDGTVSDATEEENYIRSLMLEISGTSVFLCDSKKFGKTSNYILTNIDNVDFAVFDKPYETLKTKCNLIE